METSQVQLLKLAIVAMTGLSKDALHIYVGLAVFLGIALLLRRSLRSWLPWLGVLLVACAGEIVDAIDDSRTVGHWRWGASVHDLLNTMFWPTMLVLFARLRQRLGAGRHPAAA